MRLINQEHLKNEVQNVLLELYDQYFEANYILKLVVERPRDEKFGDVAVPLFDLAKLLRLSPVVIAKDAMVALLQKHPEWQMNTVSGYLNFFWDKDFFVENVIINIAENYGQNDSLKNERIIIEFSGPNTNKPLHLGHMRNNALGESLSRILKKSGAQIFKVNIVNDRGVHICKSMLAYKMFGNGQTPESLKMKSDHFVGDYYVKYAQWEKECHDAESQVQAMLNAWEAGEAETLELWRLMNHWAVSGIRQTYERTGISFDKIYYESETYKLGKDITLKGYEEGVFFKAEDGSLRLDISEITAQDDETSDEKATKVFLRSDGTSIYITQDLGTAVARYEDFPFDRMIYVVAHEQKRHFEVLFYALKKMGYAWAEQLHHLSYGMVNLPDGKMKSREGTVVDADDLLESLTLQAREAGESAYKKGGEESFEDVAFDVALGALHYFLLQINPVKDMVFNSKESLSFNGNTGPYLQYTYARIKGMLRKNEAKVLLNNNLFNNYSVLAEEHAWRVVKLVADFPAIVAKAAQEYSPAVIASYLYDLAKTFNKFYTEQPILKEENQVAAAMRLLLSKQVAEVLKTGMELLVIPVVERM